MSYVASDISRSNFRRLDESKQWVSDKGAKFMDGVFNLMGSIANDYLNRLIGETHTTTNTKELRKLCAIFGFVEPVAAGLINPQSTERSTLLIDIVKYIGPHVAV